MSAHLIGQNNIKAVENLLSIYYNSVFKLITRFFVCGILIALIIMPGV